MKVETHNHPTAISPFPGAATGSGGEIRDEGATGRGSKPKAGLCGFSVSNLRIPGFERPWEGAESKPDRIASPLAIMIEGPIGAASFNNEFGRPNLAGYFRTYEQEVAGARARLPQADHAGRRRRQHPRRRTRTRRDVPAGALLIQLGGPGMLIGMGGGSASSMTTGSNTADLDFDSVQRGNAEIQRRAQEVIDRCWALGDANPILSIHDVGAGGLSNALPEIAHGAGRGARIDLRAAPNEEPGMTPREVWCNEAQERYVLAIAPARLDAFRALCERERCPFAVVGEVTERPAPRGARPAVRQQAGRHGPAGAAGQAAADDARRGARPAAARSRSTPAAIEIGRTPLDRVLRAPTVADKTFLITIGDRTVGGLCSRDQMVGPWQVPVADCATTLLSFEGYAGEAFAIGERTPLAVIERPGVGPDGGGARRSRTSPRRRSRTSSLVKLSANWMAAAGLARRGRGAVRHGARGRARPLPALGVSIPVGKDSMSMRTAWEEDGQRREVVGAAVAHRLGVRAVRRRARDAGRRSCGPTRGPTVARADRPGDRAGAGWAGRCSRRSTARPATRRPTWTTPRAIVGLFARAGRSCGEAGRVLAYHDRSDGGLFVTLCEMAFAGHCGRDDRRRTRLRTETTLAPALFAEELGAVLQVRDADVDARRSTCCRAPRPRGARRRPPERRRRDPRRARRRRWCSRESRVALQRAWSETTWQMQSLRDNPECARQEYDRILDADDPGMSPRVDLRSGRRRGGAVRRHAAPGRRSRSSATRA